MPVGVRTWAGRLYYYIDDSDRTLHIKDVETGKVGVYKVPVIGSSLKEKMRVRTLKQTLVRVYGREGGKVFRFVRIYQLDRMRFREQ